MSKQTAVRDPVVVQILTGARPTDVVIHALLDQLRAGGGEGALLALDTDPATLPKGAKVLVPVLPTQIDLAERVAKGARFDRALADWTAETDRLLSVCRGLRSRAVLLDALALLAGEGTALATVEAKFALSLAPAAMPDLPNADLQALAAAILGLDSGALKTAKTLEGKLHPPLSYPRPKPDAETDTPLAGLAQALAGVTDAVGSQSGADLLTQEVALLRESLGHSLKALKEAETLCAQQGAQLQQNQDNIADKHMLEVLNDSLEKRLAEKDRDRRRREAVLGTVLLQREQGERTQIASLRTQLTAVQHQAQQLQEEIDHIYRSKSWKLTSPMRSARRGLSKGATD